MQNNMIVKYIDAHTNLLLDTNYFFDPDLKWVVDKNKNVRLYTSWGCGLPTEEWLSRNPPPKVK